MLFEAAALFWAAFSLSDIGRCASIRLAAAAAAELLASPRLDPAPVQLWLHDWHDWQQTIGAKPRLREVRVEIRVGGAIYKKKRGGVWGHGALVHDLDSVLVELTYSCFLADADRRLRRYLAPIKKAHQTAHCTRTRAGRYQQLHCGRCARGL